MSGKSQFLARVMAIGLSLGVIVPLSSAVVLYPTEAAAKAPKKSTLPKPYVSKALKAVLMPVTKEVARKFKLAKGSKGVMVVSVKPDGIAKLAGLKPGDVISTILGRQVRKPSDVDTIIAYYLAGGTTDYKIGGTRKGGRTYRAATYITPAYFYAPIDVYTLSSWSSFNYETYSYSEYVSYYSQDIYTSYERSESYIQETITETSFVSEMTSETNYEYSSYDEQVVDGSYVKGGSGAVWQDGETDVVYDPADDPTSLEVPLDSAADDADPFSADQGDADYDTAAIEADAGTEADPTLYDNASAAAPDAAAEDPAASQDTTATEEPAATQDTAATDDTAVTAVTEDPAPTDDTTAAEDPAQQDQGSMDDGSGADQSCPGQIVDGTCVDSSSDTGSADTGSADTGSYEDTSSADSGGGDSGGGDSGRGEEYVPQE